MNFGTITAAIKLLKEFDSENTEKCYSVDINKLKNRFINLKVLETMTKMELIKKNIQDKSSGILIINQLVK